MSKKNITRRKKNASAPAIPWKIIVPVAVLVILILTIVLLLLPGRESSADPESTAQTTEAAQNESQGGSVQASTGSAVNEATASTGQTDSTSETQTETQPETETASNSVVDNATDSSIALERGLKITKIGSYTGIYMEDGSDELVSGIMMIKVENTGEDYIQYAEIVLTGDSGTANFTLSTLFPGQSVVVLEKDRQTYTSGVNYTAVAKNVAVFSSVPSLCGNQLELQALDGVLNVTNISGTDITGDIMIYYKNSSNGLLYGGITYRIRISGGIKSGEIRQLVADHFSASGSTVMFITCGE